MSTSISEQLQPLIEIQEIDIRLSGFNQEENLWNQGITETEERLAVIGENLSQLKDSRIELQKERDRLQLEINEEQDRINNYEKRIREITNQREYQALTREVSISKKARMDAEDATLELMEKIEAANQEIADVQKAHDQVAAELKEKIAARDEASGNASTEADPLRKKRTEIAKKIDPKIMAQYTNIRRRHTVVITTAESETCTGCNRKLPPQLYIQVLRDTQLVGCPACKRLLLPPTREADTGTDGNAAAA